MISLASYAATAAIMVPFGGHGVTIEQHSRVGIKQACGHTAEPRPRPAAACVFRDDPRRVHCSHWCEYPWLLAHELGHVLDFAYLTEAHRNEFAALHGRPWHHEVFAEAYAACATRQNATGDYHDAWLRVRSTRGRRVCRAIRRWSNASTLWLNPIAS